MPLIADDCINEVRNARQAAIMKWVRATFYESRDVHERIRRLLEEVIELAQAEWLPLSEVHRISEAVYRKLPGDPQMEAGAVGVTLLAYCETVGISADKAERTELSRILQVDPETFRQRHRAKVAVGIASPIAGDQRRQMYPEGWPRCPGCGDFTLDGKATCGRIECIEALGR